MICELKEEERLAAIDNAIAIIRRNLPLYTYKCQDTNTVDGIYKAIDNIEWTTGFWPGELWLAYLENGDETFAHAAGIAVESFRDRIRDHIAVDHHDMGFLYTPSCVAAWMIKKDAHAREAAITAADNLVSRFQEKGQFIQAWGKVGDPKEYRLIIDCLLNLPLLFWATETTGDGKYRDIAERHFSTAIGCVLRPDDSTYHTYYFDPETGKPDRGVTAQGNRNGSAWARGQAWGIYGSALAYRHTGSDKALDVFRRSLSFFLSNLPSDVIPYWDFDFDNPSDEPRDSSALAIVICAMLEAADDIEGEEGNELRDKAGRLMAPLYGKCAVRNPEESNGLLLHGTYARKSQWNTCRNRGVDECNLWGDYYYLEALRRLKGKWEPYW